MPLVQGAVLENRHKRTLLSGGVESSRQRLEITGASLEDVFVQLTQQPEVPR